MVYNILEISSYGNKPFCLDENSAGGEIRTREPLRDRPLKPAPLAWLGYPCPIKKYEEILNFSSYFFFISCSNSFSISFSISLNFSSYSSFGMVAILAIASLLFNCLNFSNSMPLSMHSLMRW